MKVRVAWFWSFIDTNAVNLFLEHVIFPEYPTLQLQWLFEVKVLFGAQIMQYSSDKQVKHSPGHGSQVFKLEL